MSKGPRELLQEVSYLLEQYRHVIGAAGNRLRTQSEEWAEEYRLWRSEDGRERTMQLIESVNGIERHESRRSG